MDANEVTIMERVFHKENSEYWRRTAHDFLLQEFIDSLELSDIPKYEKDLRIKYFKERLNKSL